MNPRERRSSWTRFSLACSRRRLRAGAVLVALLAGLAYLPSLDHGFIYDDYWTVVGNRHLDKGLGELLSAAASGRSVEWKMPDATRPTIGVSLWLDRQLFELSASGHHLHSLALYAGVSVLVFLLAFGLFRRLSAALGAGVAFAVMPLHCEVASAVNYREDLLASLGLFGALALCFWPARAAGRWQPYAVAALWWYALASKESALVGPLLFAALALLRRPARWTREGALGLAAAAVAALWLNWRFGLSALGEQLPRAEDATWLERGLRTVRFELWSAAKSFFPLAASPEYDPPPVPHWGWLAAGVALVVGAAALYRRPRARPLLGLLGVALLAPLLTCPLVAPTNEVADRYWFVGSLASALALGWGTQWLARRQKLAALGLLAVLGAAGVQRCWSAAGVWASEVSLWTTSVALAPRSPRAWASLSRVHRMADQDELAERTIQRALSIRPDYVPALVAQALNHLWVGDRSGARRVLGTVVPKSDLHRDLLAVASRCAFLPTDAAAGECARRAVPKGMVLGDPELLRRESERFLAIPLEP